MMSRFADKSVLDLSLTEIRKADRVTKLAHKAPPTKPEAPVTKII